jgi:DNA primase
LDFHEDWYYSNHWKYKNRVILPLRYNKKIVGYTARDLFQNKKAKYLSTIPKNFVYGLDRQTDNKQFIIVTEGYFDSILTDGVAIGSNEINDNQADIIEDLGKQIIVLPDRNKASAKLAYSAIDRGWAVSFPPWDSGIVDANDAAKKYGRYFMVKTVMDFAVTNSTKAKVLTKQICKD